MERKPVDGVLALEEAKNRDRIALEAEAKFKFFFVGLVFAILSFAIQFPLKVGPYYLRIVETASWVCIAITGLLSLTDIGGFSVSRPYSLATGGRRIMWVAFSVGVALLLVSKIWTSLQ